MLLKTNRNFRFLFTASALSNLGDGIAMLALPWLASLLTRDAFLIAVVAAAFRLPWLVFTAPAGVITDRMHRGRLMVFADVVRAIAVAAIVILIMQVRELGIAEQPAVMVWGLAGLAFLLGMGEVLKDNAAQTALPSVVDGKDLETANGQLWSLEQVVGTFVGPPLAGFLIAWAVPAPFQVIVLCFALAAVFVAAIQFPPRIQPVQSASFWQDMKTGGVWLWRHKTILKLGILLGFINMLTAGYATLHVLISQEILGLNAFQHGLLLTAPAFGGVLAGIIGPSIITKLGTQRVFLGAQILFVVEPVVFTCSANPFVIGAGMSVAMFAAVAYNIVTVSYRQRYIPDDLLGRVNALFRMLGWGAIPIGTLLMGSLVVMFEADLGRQTALRLPFALSIIGLMSLFVFSRLSIRVDQDAG